MGVGVFFDGGVGFRADSCESESKRGMAPEITGITALDAQIKYLN